jgi:antitoxin ParD1/3/4
MSIQLTPQLEELIQEKMASGRYHDANEVLSEALHALDDLERLEALRAELAIGDAQIERGEYEEWTPELRARIADEARQIVAEGRTPNAVVFP